MHTFAGLFVLGIYEKPLPTLAVWSSGNSVCWRTITKEVTLRRALTSNPGQLNFLPSVRWQTSNG